VIKEEALQTIKISKESRLGYLYFRVLLFIVWFWIEWNACEPWILPKCSKLFMFLEFSRNRLAASNDSLGDACFRTQFLGFLYELPSGCVLSAKRHELAFLVARFSQILWCCWCLVKVFISNYKHVFYVYTSTTVWIGDNCTNRGMIEELGFMWGLGIREYALAMIGVLFFMKVIIYLNKHEMCKFDRTWKIWAKPRISIHRLATHELPLSDTSDVGRHTDFALRWVSGSNYLKFRCMILCNWV